MKTIKSIEIIEHTKKENITNIFFDYNVFLIAKNKNPEQNKVIVIIITYNTRIYRIKYVSI